MLVRRWGWWVGCGLFGGFWRFGGRGDILGLCLAQSLARREAHLEHHREGLVGGPAGLLFVLGSLEETLAEALLARLLLQLATTLPPVLFILERSESLYLLSAVAVGLGRGCGRGVDEELVGQIVVFVFRHGMVQAYII